MRTGRSSPFVPFDTAKDTWACWDHKGVTGWPDCYDPTDPNSCDYDPWGSQLPYEDMAMVRDTVQSWYPECNYNTHTGRYWGADLTGVGMIVTELRLYRWPDGTPRDNNPNPPKELLETRYDLWEIP